MPEPRIMFYHDGRHAHIYRYEPPMQKEEYQACIDELAGTPIEAVMFCLGEGRTMLHDTKAGELLGHNVEKWDHMIFRRTYQNAKHLIDEGNDPLRIVCERAHDKGMLLYPTLLVQRGGINHAGVRCSDFRKLNPHLEIGAAGDLDPDFPGFDGLDLKHKEARDERFAIVEEVMTEYPVDGFELMLNHMPYFFHPKEIDSGRHLMTDWVGRVHEAVKRSGADRELVVRLPDGVEDCLSAGLDPEEWVRLGIVDVLVGEEFDDMYHSRPTDDYRPLLELAKGSGCRVHASLHSVVATDRLNNVPISMVRAMACNYWAQGVEGIYLAEWYNMWPYEATFYEKLREVPYPDIMATKDKFYFIATRTEGAAGDARAPLPAKLEVNKPVAIKFTISDDLPRWDSVGRVHEVLLRMRVIGNTELDRLSFKLNGQELPERLLRRINEMYRMSSPRYRVLGAYWYVFRLDREHWPVEGEYTIEVTLLQRDPDMVEEFCTLRDVEMEVKYLMGKSFHRGYVDPDLGPYEYVVT